MHPFRLVLSFCSVYESAWAFVHVNERQSEKLAKNLPCQHKTRKHVTRRHSGWAVAFMFFTQFLFLKLSLSLSLSLWRVITVVGSSRVGKRFSFPLWLPPSKLCTGYYRDLFTKCSFCLFLSSPLCSQSLHFPFKFLPLPLSCLKLSVSPYVLTDAFIRLPCYFFLSLLPGVSIPD